jgi:hypothetical protein
MYLALATRRAVAVTAATTLLLTGGVLLSGAASAAITDPVVSSVTPSAVDNTGPVPVTINGSNFTTADVAVFHPRSQGMSGTYDLTGATSQTSTTTALKVTVPATIALPGDYDVTVSRPGGSATCMSCFTIANVSVASPAAPAVSGSAAGASTGTTARPATAVDVTGSGFAKAAKVDFLLPGSSTPDPGMIFHVSDPNDTAANGYASATLIRGFYDQNASAFTPGKHQLRVTNADGATGATAEFWQPLFAATGVSPSSVGAGAQNRTVTVTGSGIRAGSRIAIQNLSGTSGTDITVGTATVNAAGTAISAPVTTTGTATTGTARSVSVVGPDGGIFTVGNAFTVTAGPTVTSLNNDTLGQGASVDVTINGTGFAAGGTTAATRPVFTFPIANGTSGVTGVTKSATATSAVVTITVASNATLGNRSVTVTNPDGGSSTLAPTSPPAPATPTSPLTITPAPIATSVTPASAPAGATRTVALVGTGFDTKGMSVVITLPPAPGATRTPDTSLTVGAVTVSSTTQATFTLTTGATSPSGLRDLVLTNKSDFGSSVCGGCFGIDDLTVTPTSGSNTGPATLTFARTGLVQGSTVQLVRAGDPAYQPHLNGGSVTVTASGMSAAFDLTSAAPGPYNAIITSGTAKYSCASCFTVTGVTPTLTSITPNAAGQGAANRPVTIVGTKLSRGEQVTIAGATVHDVAFVSPTQITALVDVPAATAAGAKDVTVTNADGNGTATLTGAFTVTAAPVVKTITPAALGQGAASQQVTITGTGFVAGATGQPSSALDLGPGVTVTNVVVTKGTQTVPIIGPFSDDTAVATVTVAEGAAIGQRDVNVSNPDGGVGTLAKGFTVNAGPKVVSISPTAVTPTTSGRTLVLTGSGFSTTSGKTAVPTIAGLTLTNPVVSPDGTTLTVTASVDSGAAKGVRNVVVTNPADSGVGTCVSCFAVATPPGAPTGVTASSQGTSVVVTWLAPADTGGVPLTSYVVSARTADGQSSGAPVTVDGKTRTATLTGLTAGTTYVVSVIARNAVGDSPAGTATSTTAATGSIPQVTLTVGILSAGQRETVYLTGTPGQVVELLAASKPGITFTVAARKTLDSTGTALAIVGPMTNTRLYARSAAGSGAVKTIVVRTALTMTATSRGTAVTFSGTARPIRPGQTVAIYYRKGTQVIVVAKTQVQTNGTWVFSRTFAPGSVTFFAQTGTDVINATGKSPDRRVTFS